MNLFLLGRCTCHECINATLPLTQHTSVKLFANRRTDHGGSENAKQGNSVMSLSKEPTYFYIFLCCFCYNFFNMVSSQLKSPKRPGMFKFIRPGNMGLTKDNNYTELYNINIMLSKDIFNTWWWNTDIKPHIWNINMCLQF